MGPPKVAQHYVKADGTAPLQHMQSHVMCRASPDKASGPPSVAWKPVKRVFLQFMSASTGRDATLRVLARPACGLPSVRFVVPRLQTRVRCLLPKHAAAFARLCTHAHTIPIPCARPQGARHTFKWRSFSEADWCRSAAAFFPASQYARASHAPLLLHLPAEYRWV